MDELKEQISTWLNSDKKKIDEGLSLLSKVRTNQGLVKRLACMSNTQRVVEKIVWELGKFVPDAVIEVKPTGYPAIIIKLKTELETIYQQLVVLKKELTDLPENNEPETMERAQYLAEVIAELEEKNTLWFEAKELFFKDGTVPDEKVMFPVDEVIDPTDVFGLNKLSGIELVTRKKNLEANLTKQRNFLLYQTKTKPKEDVKNPMPEGEKREALVAKVELANQELEAINKKIDADKTK